MNIGIVGSREFVDAMMMQDIVQRLRKAHGEFTLVSGGARGADSIAEAVCIAEGLPKPIIHYPDSKRAYAEFGDDFRKRAFGRNGYIVADSDMLVAFFVTPEPSGGTLNTLNHARRKGIHIHYHTTQGWFKENCPS